MRDKYLTTWRSKFLVIMTWGLFLLTNYITLTNIFSFSSSSGSSIQDSSNRIFTIPHSYIGFLFLFMYEYLSLISLLSHIRAVLGDPGKTSLLVTTKAPSNCKDPRICRPCGYKWKPPRAHHCRKCNTCIFRMDHHCAWINNCVGILNQKFFILFLVYTALLCIFQLLLLFITFCIWVLDRPLKSFLSDQLESLESNSTLVESHQHTHGALKSFWLHASEIFGHFTFLWFFPVSPNIVLDLNDEQVAERLRKRHKRLIHNLKKGHQRISTETDLKLERSIKDKFSDSILQKRYLTSKKSTDSDDDKFKNVYITPDTDIGVELDDNSRFIRLEDLNDVDSDFDNS